MERQDGHLGSIKDQFKDMSGYSFKFSVFLPRCKPLDSIRSLEVCSSYFIVMCYDSHKSQVPGAGVTVTGTISRNHTVPPNDWETWETKVLSYHNCEWYESLALKQGVYRLQYLKPIWETLLLIGYWLIEDMAFYIGDMFTSLLEAERRGSCAVALQVSFTSQQHWAASSDIQRICFYAHICSRLFLLNVYILIRTTSVSADEGRPGLLYSEHELMRGFGMCSMYHGIVGLGGLWNRHTHHPTWYYLIHLIRWFVDTIVFMNYISILTSGRTQ